MSEQVGAVGSGAAGSLSIEVAVGRSNFVSTGDAAAVLEAFSAFREFYAEVATRPGVDAPDGSEQDHQQEREPAGNGQSGGDSERSPGDATPPLKPFLAGKTFRGNHYIALGIALWARRKHEKASVTADDIEGYWKVSGFRVPANLRRDIQKAATEGWLHKEKDDYSVTGFGEEKWDALPAKGNG